MIANSLYHSLLEWPILQIAVFMALLSLSVDLFFKFAYGAAKNSLDEELERLASASTSKEKSKTLREGIEQEAREQKTRIKELKEQFQIWTKALKAREADSEQKKLKILQATLERKEFIEKALVLKVEKSSLINNCLKKLESEILKAPKCNQRAVIENSIKAMRSKQ